MDIKEFGRHIAKLRENSGYKSQRSLAIDAGIAPATLSRIESGTQEAKPPTLKKLSSYLKDVTYEDLMVAAGYIEDVSDNHDSQDLPLLNKKDERDIQRKLQEMIDNLNSTDGFAAQDGNGLDDLEEEDREILISSLENSLRIAKRLAKQKFTPKKYR